MGLSRAGRFRESRRWRWPRRQSVGGKNRAFLLTLGVVDDLLAITVIAVFYTDRLALGPLALALIPGGLFALAVQRGLHHWWLRVPLATITWALVHAGGVHANVAGVLLGSQSRFWAGPGSPLRNGASTCCGRCPPELRRRCLRSSQPV